MYYSTSSIYVLLSSWDMCLLQVSYNMYPWFVLMIEPVKCLWAVYTEKGTVYIFILLFYKYCTISNIHVYVLWIIRSRDKYLI